MVTHRTQVMTSTGGDTLVRHHHNVLDHSQIIHTKLWQVSIFFINFKRAGDTQIDFPLFVQWSKLVCNFLVSVLYTRLYSRPLPNRNLL